jgi:hypothetical protein
MPLYFTVAPDADDASEAAQLAALAARLTLDQQREALALDAALSGRVTFETYPSATDSFVCAALGQPALVPWPAQLSGGQIQPQIIPLLGVQMQRASELQESLRSGSDVAAELDEFLAQLSSLATSVSYGRIITARAPNLANALQSLGAASGDPEQLVARLSELRLALDSAVGFGSLDLRQGYQDAFAAYSEQADGRLASAVDLQPQLAQLLGSDNSTALITLLNDQRAALALLRDEVKRGRLSKTQLGQRVRAQAQRAEQAAFTVYEHIDSATCRPLSGKPNSPQARLESLRCGLSKLAVSVWPD